MKLFAFALGAAGLVTTPAFAQGEPQWVQCFDSAAPGDIAALNLEDYLAEVKRSPKPKRDFWAEFEAAWSGCADASWEEKQDLAARGYVMNLVGWRGASEKMASFGISEEYMAQLDEMGQAPSDDEIWTIEVEQQFDREQKLGTIDATEANIFVEVVIMYVGSMRDLSSGPPTL